MSVRSGNSRSGRPGGARDGDLPQNIATAIADISERSTLLVREEIELAKAEVTEKASKLARGAIVGIAAGIFFATAGFFALFGVAWLLYYYLPIGNDYTYFWGFFALAVILLVLGVIAGLIAARAVKRGSPPTPDMAIEEARLIRDTVATTPEIPYSPAAPQAPSWPPAAGGAIGTGTPYGGATPASTVPAAGTAEPAPGAASPPAAGSSGPPQAGAPGSSAPLQAGAPGPTETGFPGPAEEATRTPPGSQPSTPSGPGDAPSAAADPGAPPADPGAPPSAEQPPSPEPDQDAGS